MKRLYWWIHLCHWVLDSFCEYLSGLSSSWRWNILKLAANLLFHYTAVTMKHSLRQKQSTTWPAALPHIIIMFVKPFTHLQEAGRTRYCTYRPTETWACKVHKQAPKHTKAHVGEHTYVTMVSDIQTPGASPYDFIQQRTHKGNGHSIFNKQKNQNGTKRKSTLLTYIYSILFLTAEAEITGRILRADWSGFMLHSLVFKQHASQAGGSRCGLHIFRTINNKDTLWPAYVLFCHSILETSKWQTSLFCAVAFKAFYFYN